jgi:hypothetical protein
MAVHPLSTFTHAPKWPPTVPNAGNSIASLAVSFEFKSGYLKVDFILKNAIL